MNLDEHLGEFFDSKRHVLNSVVSQWPPHLVDHFLILFYEVIFDVFDDPETEL